MSMLTKEQIMANDTLAQETIHVEKWGGDLLVREATALERDEYEESILRPTLSKEDKQGSTKPDFRNSKARFIVKCVLDPDTKERMFTDKDAEALGHKSAHAVDQVFKAVRKLSGMEIGASEEAAKNSDGAQTGSSPSD